MSRPGSEGEDDLDGLVDSLEREQQRLIFDRFDHQDAWALGNVLVDLATAADLAVTIDVRTTRQILFHCARPGTSPDNDRWVKRKAHTVFHFLEPSWLVRNRFLARGADFDRDSGLDPRRYAAHGGSFPITVTTAGLVAAVTVSGLPQREDHELVVRGLETFLDARRA